MKRLDFNFLLTVVIFLCLTFIGLGIAYAALSATLKTNTSPVTADSLTWNIGFLSETVSGVASGSDTSYMQCGTVTANASQVSGVRAILSDVGDKCSYTLHIVNNGDIGAKITSISTTNPTGYTCTTTGSTMVCGDITYKLRYTSSSSSTYLAVNNTFAAPSNTAVYLTVEYTGSTAAADDFEQNNFGYTIVFGQN